MNNAPSRLSSSANESNEQRHIPVPASGMIIREKQPVNLEMPFGALDGFVTPAERFYVRCHHPIPKIDAQKWRLKIEGEVERPFELTSAELREMETRTVTAVMECAGNGRAFLVPQRDGAQWESGAVGNAVWTGVPLGALLKQAGVRAAVREVILEGADEGELDKQPAPAGEIHYSHSLPLAKAADDVLLAFQMNGRELTPAHGFPLRAVVPGWYGMAAVKWLTRIIATTEPYHGYYQTTEYAYWEHGPSAPSLVAITGLQVKAQIARPEYAEVVRAGEAYRVHGAAWTGDAEIAKVEVSSDGGDTWSEARLLGESLRNAWRLWEYRWPVPTHPGRAVLMARATDSEGRIQPPERHDDLGSYVVHHWLPVEVTIQ